MKDLPNICHLAEELVLWEKETDASLEGGMSFWLRRQASLIHQQKNKKKSSEKQIQKEHLSHDDSVANCRGDNPLILQVRETGIDQKTHVEKKTPQRIFRCLTACAQCPIHPKK